MPIPRRQPIIVIQTLAQDPVMQLRIHMRQNPPTQLPQHLRLKPRRMIDQQRLRRRHHRHPGISRNLTERGTDHHSLLRRHPTSSHRRSKHRPGIQRRTEPGHPMRIMNRNPHPIPQPRRRIRRTGGLDQTTAIDLPHQHCLHRRQTADQHLNQVHRRREGTVGQTERGTPRQTPGVHIQTLQQLQHSTTLAHTYDQTVLKLIYPNDTGT
jgi:hypothetical protein